MLEVIATSLADALAAARGGADRLEVVRAMEADGLTPTLETIAPIRERVPLPLRVMLRSNAGFTVSAAELAALCREAEALRRAGADSFVFGFLTPDGALDLPALATLNAVVAPCPWTLHRAFDSAANARAAWDAAVDLPGLTHVLSAGSPAGLPHSLDALCARAGWQTTTVRWLAGGGLQPEHLARLRAVGIGAVHAGRAVRHRECWDEPVDVEVVRRLRTMLDDSASTGVRPRARDSDE